MPYALPCDFICPTENHRLFITAEVSLFHSSSRPLNLSVASGGPRQGTTSSGDRDDEEYSDTGSAVDPDQDNAPINRTGIDRIESVEDANAIRNRLRIKVRGNGSIPHPALTFRDMDLSEEIKAIF
jgi:hypothetical protein